MEDIFQQLKNLRSRVGSCYWKIFVFCLLFSLQKKKKKNGYILTPNQYEKLASQVKFNFLGEMQNQLVTITRQLLCQGSPSYE